MFESRAKPSASKPSAATSSRRTGKASPSSEALGKQLALLRKLNALSLEQVATRAEITKSYLSKLERGLSSPTIATLMKLARALETSVEKLVSESNLDDEILLVRAQDRVPLGRQVEDDGYVYELIASQRPDKAMMPFIMSPPLSTDAAENADESSHYMSHAGEELIYLISGRMEVFFSDRSYILKAGDALYFNASIPHRTRSVGKKLAQALVVATSVKREP